MKRKAIVVLLLTVAFGCGNSFAESLPTDEAGAIEYLSAKGVRITKDEQGHAVKLMSSGKPPMTVEEYQLIGKLTHLEQIGINGAPLTDDQWGFLKSLPKLNRLAIWHGHAFATLEPFSGLPVESLTIGGCMGLRRLNQDNPDKLRHVVKTLHDLPNLKKANLYHSPVACDDSHIAHVAKEFSKLEDLRLDLSAPRGTEMTISPEGLKSLQKLPLKILNLENAHSLTAEHFAAIASVKSLTALLIDARRKPVPAEGVAAFQKLRPDVEVVVAKPGEQAPPRVKKRQK